MAEINRGVETEKLLAFREAVRQEPTRADRNPTVVATWVGGDRSRVEYNGMITHLGGDDTLNPMQMLLGALAACDVDLIAMHASFLGLKVENLSVEVNGHFNVQSYLGIEDTPGPGYDDIGYTVHLDAPDATPEQIEKLIYQCKAGSPVGDTLERALKLKMDFKVNEQAAG